MMSPRIMENDTRDNSFIFIWIACSVLTFVISGLGRLSQGETFLKTYETTSQNISYAVGGVFGSILLGLLFAKLIQWLRS